MTSTAQRQRISVEGYLAGEERATIKHAYIVDEGLAMAGASAYLRWP